MIAAKNMAGKETVDSSMLSACSLPTPLHNAIVCANRWFCWQRLDDHKAAGNGGRAQLLRQSDVAPLGLGRPEALLGLFRRQVSLRTPI